MNWIAVRDRWSELGTTGILMSWETMGPPYCFGNLWLLDTVLDAHRTHVYYEDTFCYLTLTNRPWKWLFNNCSHAL